MGAAVEFRSVGKSYGSVVALADVNMIVRDGEFLTLLGPSGSGKTTLLNVVSGMVSPTEGEVLIQGQDVTRVSPRHRGLGMVFQNYALFPHMTVFENVAFPLRVRKVPGSEINRQVNQALEMVRLGSFARRKPRELSGGQQQRVSIARCIVYKPKIILMDEPLGALDKKLRLQLQIEMKRIHRDLNVTILYVTHDQEEALLMSDRVCVMNNARIAQIGPPAELYFKPQSEFVADFVGEANLFRGVVHKITTGVAEVDCGSYRVRALASDALNEGMQATVLVRPEAVHISQVPVGEAIEAIVIDRIFLGQNTRYVLRHEAMQVLAQLTGAWSAPNYGVGDRVWLSWAPEDGIAFASPQS